MNAVGLPRPFLQYQGLGVRHPYYNQESKHLSVLLAETDNPSSPTGQLLVGEAEHLRLEIGLPGESTDAPWPQLGPVITHTWLTQFFKFAAAHEIIIHDPLPKLLPQRAHNPCLMSVLLAGQYYTTDDLRMLLAWRQYFDAVFLSDIADAAGTHLLKTVWDGLPLNHMVDRPPRTRPLPRRSLSLALWRRALTPLILSARNCQLRQPHGLQLSPPGTQW
jgi:hypothetical protein